MATANAAEILAHCPATVWYEAAPLPSGKRGLIKHVISDKAMNYGGGVGDLNGDGRPDVLRPDAWFEAPADPRQGQWIEHAWALGAKDGKAEHTPQMLVLRRERRQAAGRDHQQRPPARHLLV